MLPEFFRFIMIVGYINYTQYNSLLMGGGGWGSLCIPNTVLYIVTICEILYTPCTLVHIL